MGGINHLSTFDADIKNVQFCIDIFYVVSCNIKHITTISNVHLQ